MALGKEAALCETSLGELRASKRSGINVTSQFSRPTGRMPGCSDSQVFVKRKVLPVTDEATGVQRG